MGVYFDFPNLRSPTALQHASGVLLLHQENMEKWWAWFLAETVHPPEIDRKSKNHPFIVVNYHYPLVI